jgi:hypothetical protein
MVRVLGCRLLVEAPRCGLDALGNIKDLAR